MLKKIIPLFLMTFNSFAFAQSTLTVAPFPNPPENNWLYKNGTVSISKLAPVEINNGITLPVKTNDTISLEIHTWYPKELHLHTCCTNLKIEKEGRYQLLFQALVEDKQIHCLYSLVP